MKIAIHKKLLCGLWYVFLLTGLNSVMHFIDPGKLILILALFFLTDLLLDRFAFLVNLFISLIIVHSSYYIGSFFNYRWLAWLAEDVSKDIVALSKTGITIVSPVTSMVFALIALIFLQSVATRLFVRGKGITLALCLGAAALAAAYLWEGTGSAWYTICYVVTGLVIKATVPMEPREAPFLGRWVRVLAIWVLALVSVAAALPAPGLDLSDWLSGGPATRYDPLGIPRKVGYSVYDDSLGGPLVEDNTPALRVSAPVPLYLKGECRSVYTGKGWASEPAYFKVDVPELQPGHLNGQEITISVEALTSSDTLFAPRYPLAFNFPAGEVKITALPNYPPLGASQLTYEYYRYKSTIRDGDVYEIKVFLAEDDPVFLRTLTSERVDSRYLSLENVPERVQQLAQSLVQEQTNGYDKAVALATFLRYGHWDYSLTTYTPPANIDFVENFLFEERKGYCVHFSTAFVIMARSVGLPARWVKGYSFGEKERDGSYLVTNNSAHSWAEIWFDDYGWVPFEPTPGGLHLRPEVSSSDPTPAPVDPNQNDPGKTRPDRTPEEPGGSSKGITGLLKDWRLYAVSGAGLVFITLLYFLLRKPGGRSIKEMYARLQGRLRIFGWQRRQWETPREHLQRVDRLPSRTKFTRFIHSFEGSVYGGAEEPTQRQKDLGRKYTLFGLLLHRIIRVKEQ